MALIVMHRLDTAFYSNCSSSSIVEMSEAVSSCRADLLRAKHIRQAAQLTSGRSSLFVSMNGSIHCSDERRRYVPDLRWSSVFTVQRYAWARSLLSSGVRLSDTFATAKDIVKLLSRPDSPIILVFWPGAPIPNWKGDPFIGALNTRRAGKICAFRLKSPFFLETVRDRPTVAMERQ